MRRASPSVFVAAGATPREALRALCASIATHVEHTACARAFDDVHARGRACYGYASTARGAVREGTRGMRDEDARSGARGFAASAAPRRRGAAPAGAWARDALAAGYSQDVRWTHPRASSERAWGGDGYRIRRGFAAEPLRAETPKEDEAPAAEPIQLDLAALDRARAEIDMLHRERQLKSWQRVYASTKAGVMYVASLGPWALKLSRMSKSEWRATVSEGWVHFKEEMSHYWSGAKLLWVEVKIASRLSWRLMSGQELSRRERKQLTRTTADVFRLVPFAAFVLIPFMELLLPVALKLFPNMLPSTFRNELKHEEEMKKKLKAKLEVARFLQDTVKVMAKGLKHSRSGVTRERADDLYVFMKKIRSGAQVTNDDILKFSKLFSDEFTLYQVNRAQLVNMCKFVGLAPYGTDTFLRFQLRNKLREIKNDDRLIKLEGLETMTTGELRSAARMRGMRWEEDRESLLAQLTDWIELSLKHNLPSTLLLLSRAFAITTETGAAVDAKAKVFQDLTDTLASLPEDVVSSAAVDEGLSHEKEDYTKKIEYLQREEEIIAQESKETKSVQEAEKALAEAKQEAPSVAATAEMAAPSDVVVDQAAAEMTDVTGVIMKTDAELPAPKKPEASKEGVVCAEEQATYEREKRAKRAAQLSRLLTMISDHSSVSVERQELMALVKKGLDQYEDRLEVAKESTAGDEASPFDADAVSASVDVCEKEAALTNELADQVSARVDKMLQSASKDIDEAEKRIGDKLRVLDADCDGKITMSELLKVREAFGADTLSESDEIEMVNILSGLIKADGSIAVEDLRKLTGDIIATDFQDGEDEHEDNEDDAPPPPTREPQESADVPPPPPSHSST